MGFANCIWCEKSIRADCESCAECGLEKPVAVPAAAAKARPVGLVSRSGWRFILAITAVPLMLSVAYAAHDHRLPLLAPAAAPAEAAADPGPDMPATELTDPLQRSVWVDGVRAVRRALHNPRFDDFSASFVETSDGRVVSLCGAVPADGSSVTGEGGERFISVFGQAHSTVIEGWDASFGVLWNRLCSSQPMV